MIEEIRKNINKIDYFIKIYLEQSNKKQFLDDFKNELLKDNEKCLTFIEFIKQQNFINRTNKSKINIIKKDEKTFIAYGDLKGLDDIFLKYKCIFKNEFKSEKLKSDKYIACWIIPLKNIDYIKKELRKINYF